MLLGSVELPLQLRLGLEVRLFELVAHSLERLELVHLGEQLLDTVLERRLLLSQVLDEPLRILSRVQLRLELLDQLLEVRAGVACAGVRRLQLVELCQVVAQRGDLALLLRVRLLRHVPQADERLAQSPVFLRSRVGRRCV